jgi:ABC-type branched-subunit amino acid transport system substrate-binding protein
MTMPRSRHRAIPLLLATALTAAGLAACGGGGGGGEEKKGSPGVTDKTVKIGTHTPLTGPAAAGYASISKAATAYFAYLNAKGGINGRTIEYVVKDDGYNPANTAKVVRELVQQDKVFAVVNGLGTPTHAAAVDYLNAQKVPDLLVASGAAQWNEPDKRPMTFGFNPDYITEGKILGHYLKEQKPDAVYCTLVQDDDFGVDLSAGFTKSVGALKSEQKYTTSNQDLTAQIGALKAAGCTVNLLGTVTGFTAIALGTAAKMQYRAQWVTSSSGGDQPTLLGYLPKDVGPLLLEGLVSSNYLPFDADDPWVQLFREVNTKHNADAPFTGSTIYGMSVAYTFAEALAKAGQEPTRESLVEALEGGQVKGNGIVPMTYGKDRHGAFGGVGITVVTKGVQAYVDGQAYTTDAADGPVEPYSGAPVALAAEGVPAT